MTLPDSQKPKKSAFKVSKNEKKRIEKFESVSREEVAHMAKHVKKALKLHKRSK